MKNLNLHIEHTNISPKADRKNIRQLCREAIQYNFRSVVVFPQWAYYCKEQLEGTPVKVVSIFLFPHQVSPVISDDADEIDVFIDFRYCDSRRVRITIEKKLMVISNRTKLKPVKIVVETAFLNDRELRIACKIVKKYGFAYVKSSSGLFRRTRHQGRNLALIRGALFMPVLSYTKRGLRPFIKIGVSTPYLKLSKFLFKLRGFTIRFPYIRIKSPKIKISGGIDTYKDSIKLIKRGTTLIGTSHSVEIMEKTKDKKIEEDIKQQKLAIKKAREMRKKTVPETVDNYIKERSKKSPKFKKAYDKEKRKLNEK